MFAWLRVYGSNERSALWAAFRYRPVRSMVMGRSLRIPSAVGGAGACGGDREITWEPSTVTQKSRMKMNTERFTAPLGGYAGQRKSGGPNTTRSGKQTQYYSAGRGARSGKKRPWFMDILVVKANAPMTQLSAQENAALKFQACARCNLLLFDKKAPQIRMGPEAQWIRVENRPLPTIA